MSYKCRAFAGQEDFLSNIVHLSYVGSMLGQRRRRRPNIKTALDQCLVCVVSCNQFSGYINAVNLYSIGYCWPTLDRPRHARFEAEWFFKLTVSSGLLVFQEQQTSQAINCSSYWTPVHNFLYEARRRWTPLIPFKMVVFIVLLVNVLRKFSI